MNLTNMLGMTPTPQMLGSGMAAQGGNTLMLKKLYDQLAMKAAMGDGPAVPPFEEWARAMQQQPQGLLGR